MENTFKKGAEWRRWDLHFHTKGTVKNDRFSSESFESFCDIMFEKALKDEIAVIGITDYFNIKNYKKVLEYLNRLNQNTNFSDDQKIKINKILVLPNVELRCLPVTDKGRLVNFHCIFNPEYVQNLNDDFFNEIDMAVGTNVYHMNDSGLKKLGISKGATVEDAYFKGIESFVVSHEKLIELFKRKPQLRTNTITIVSNSNNDGNSAYQKHYDFFEEGDKNSLDEVRKSIYYLSDLIFSSNSQDRDYFLGKKKNVEGKIVDEENIVIKKCGSLKGCVHGSDAHSENELFAPDNYSFCWIKADPTFEGLEQILNEPEGRIFIGEKPNIKTKVLDNRTKYIKSISIKPIAGYDGKYGKWFENIEIPLNHELIAIIGNKGSGKSAISDIIALCGFYKNQDDFSFLNKKKFRDNKHAKNFEATLTWESGITNAKNLADDKVEGEIELVKYLPQGYFERLTNEISSTEAFQKEIENVVFTHLEDDDKIGFNSFEELIDSKKKSVEKDINLLKDEIDEINIHIIKLENKLNEKYKKEVENKIQLKKGELAALIEPSAIKNPTGDSEVSEKNERTLQKIELLKAEILKLEEQIKDCQIQKQTVLIELRELKEFRNEIDFKIKDIEEFKEKAKSFSLKYNLKIDKIISLSHNLTELNSLIETKESTLSNLKSKLGEEPSTVDHFKSHKSLLEELQHQLQAEQNTLDIPQKLYQIYLGEKKAWEEKKDKIIGNETMPDTLKFYETELKYLEESLSNEIEDDRSKRLKITEKIFYKKQGIIAVYKDVKQKLDSIIYGNADLLNDYKIDIKAALSLSTDMADIFFRNINQSVLGTFYSIEGGGMELNKIIQEINFDDKESIILFLSRLNNAIHEDQRDKYKKEKRYLEDQIKNPSELYNYLFSLEFLDYNYQLMQGSKTLQQLSPGERGALLLVFYLLLDKSDIPLIIDQPEDNLDNNSVAHILVPFIRKAKSKRQIIIVTHNPNLAVVSDAEQVIYVNLNKEKNNEFTFISGSIENREVNDCIVKVLEGAMPAFNKRKQKYYE